MKTRPIIFIAPMVRAILAGTKSQTRRIVKPQPVGFVDGVPCSRIVRSRGGNVDEYSAIRCPFGFHGDELWVRENCWIAPPNFGDQSDATHTDNEGRRRIVTYDADMNDDSREVARKYGVRISPSIHMPRWASRLTLVVRSVRVERLSAITEADAVAEGFTGHRVDGHDGFPCGYSPRDEFISAFREMHNLAADADPWLWVIGFGRS